MSWWERKIKTQNLNRVSNDFAQNRSSLRPGLFRFGNTIETYLKLMQRGDTPIASAIAVLEDYSDTLKGYIHWNRSSGNKTLATNMVATLNELQNKAAENTDKLRRSKNWTVVIGGQDERGFPQFSCEGINIKTIIKPSFPLSPEFSSFALNCGNDTVNGQLFLLIMLICDVYKNNKKRFNNKHKHCENSSLERRLKFTAMIFYAAFNSWKDAEDFKKGAPLSPKYWTYFLEQSYLTLSSAEQKKRNAARSDLAIGVLDGTTDILNGTDNGGHHSGHHSGHHRGHHGGRGHSQSLPTTSSDSVSEGVGNLVATVIVKGFFAILNSILDD
ncbi:MAG: hypothetical protein GY730_07980 [bacterium]|nr:hypothetical protein [bacterium]